MKKSELTRKFKSKGCFYVGELTNHESWYSPITNQFFTIPRHDAKEVAKGTLNNIKKQSGIKF